MKFDDILALAKQGYKPSDIKELLSINVENVSRETLESKPEDVQKAETLEDVQKAETLEDVQKAEAPEEVDYKHLYEESQKKLAEAQKRNTHIDMKEQDNKLTDLEQFSDVVRSFM